MIKKRGKKSNPAAREPQSRTTLLDLDATDEEIQASLDAICGRDKKE